MRLVSYRIKQGVKVRRDGVVYCAATMPRLPSVIILSNDLFQPCLYESPSSLSPLSLMEKPQII
jgi:hypothetical protein